MDVDRIKLQEHCVEFALRLHPNQTICKPTGMAGSYPSSLAVQSEIVSPKLDLVLETASKIFMFIMAEGTYKKLSVLRRNKNVRRRKTTKRK